VFLICEGIHWDLCFLFFFDRCGGRDGGICVVMGMFDDSWFDVRVLATKVPHLPSSWARSYFSSPRSLTAVIHNVSTLGPKGTCR
jgi:hypothetical protein